MSERYSRLFGLPENLYAQGAPLLIAAGVLLKDNETGKVLAQLKFRNISEKRIQAAKVSITAFDVSGKEIPGVKEYQYLDLSAGRDGEFGQKQPIPMPDKVTRSIGAECTEVVFADGSVWSAAQNAEWKPLPSQQGISEKIKDGALVAQYRRDTTEKARFVPLDYADLWLCACGEVNRQNESACHSCHMEKGKLLAAFDPAALEAHKAAFDKAQEEKQAAENKQKAKTRKIAVIASAAVALVLAITLFANQAIKKNGQYREATDALESGKFAAASEIFQDLGEYKDCEEQFAQNVPYQKTLKILEYADEGDKTGINLAKEKDILNIPFEDMSTGELPENFPADLLTRLALYDIAAQRFTALGDYKDSQTLLADIPYRWAGTLLDANLYDLAASAYAELGDYKDSASILQDIPYRKAQDLLAAAHFDEAEKILSTLGDYKDCADLLADIPYLRAIAAYEENELDSAIEQFEGLGAYKDSAQYLIKAKYSKATLLMSTGKYSDAEALFASLGDYQDSAERAIEAKQLGCAHTYTEEVKLANTCTTDGVMLYTCPKCGHTYEKPIPAAHKYKESTTAATCTSAGKKTLTCSVCGDTKTETIPALGHDYSSATCTSPSKCSRCGDVRSEALGHTTSDGICERCGADLRKTIRYSGGVCEDKVFKISIPKGKYRITLTADEYCSVEFLIGRYATDELYIVIPLDSPQSKVRDDWYIFDALSITAAGNWTITITPV